MARAFAGTGSDGRITLSVGSLPNVEKGGGNSWAIIYRPNDNTTAQGLVTVYDSAPAQIFDINPYLDGNVYWSSGGGFTSTAYTGGVWQFLGADKGVGNVTPRFHTYRYDNDTWTHANGGGNVNDTTATPASIRIGQYNLSECLNGDIALVVFWNRVLTDAEYELLPFSLQAIYASKPDGLWLLDQSDTAQNVRDLMGSGADQTAVNNASVSTTSVPVFSYGDAAAVVSPIPTSPADIANCVLWFHASDLSGLANGDPVGISGTSPWTSRVGTSTGLQATSGSRPTKQTVSTLPVVRFDNTDDELDLNGDALTYSNNVSGITYFVRANLASTGNGVLLYTSVNGSPGNSRAGFKVSSAALQTVTRRLDADGAGVTGAGSVTSGVIANYCAKWDYANGDVFHYINGTQVGSNVSASSDGNTSATNADTAYMGEAGNPMDMDVYQVIVYNRALSDGERTIVEAWLNSGAAAPAASMVFPMRRSTSGLLLRGRR